MDINLQVVAAALSIFLIGILLRRKTLALILIAILIITHVSTSHATSYYVPEKPQLPVEDKFSSTITSFGVVRKTPGKDVLQIYIKSCGMVDVLTNSKGKIPSVREVIEYYQVNRCAIEDWRSAK